MAPQKGGRTCYGFALGILMLDTVCPRFPGDVGNALTWPFPVRYLVVKGATSLRVTAREPDRTLLPDFIAGARELETDGVRAITTSCGFLAAFQPDLAAAVSVPVMTSALLQVPMAYRLLRPGQRVGILTARENLNEQHFAGVGWSDADIPVRVAAMSATGPFQAVYINGATEADFCQLEEEVVGTALSLTHDDPAIGALVLECTNLPPFSQSIRRATGLPVFDLNTLAMQAYRATLTPDEVTRISSRSVGISI